eukprot:m.101490 g.101490  ORF g.101490 m.101490 type:complete len:99 (-) comp13200_c0_seq1:95-391(-)
MNWAGRCFPLAEPRFGCETSCSLSFPAACCLPADIFQSSRTLQQCCSPSSHAPLHVHNHKTKPSSKAMELGSTYKLMVNLFTLVMDLSIVMLFWLWLL